MLEVCERVRSTTNSKKKPGKKWLLILSREGAEHNGYVADEGMALPVSMFSRRMISISLQ